MNFKKWVKSMQTAGYNGTHKVFETHLCQVRIIKNNQNRGRIRYKINNKVTAT